MAVKAIKLAFLLFFLLWSFTIYVAFLTLPESKAIIYSIGIVLFLGAFVAVAWAFEQGFD